MFVRHLSLTEFRCYRSLDLTLPCGTVLIVGRNAQGKTSLLEAIYVLATTRSPLAGAERETVHWALGCDGIGFSRVWGEVARAGQTDTLEVLQACQPGEDGEPRFTKRVRLNQAPRRALDLLGRLNVVLFSPRDVEIVAGAPGERRRYLDVLLCQTDPDYCRALARYNRVLTQRNHLLRRLRERGGDRAELRYWDERLAQDGGTIAARRAETVAALDRLAALLHAELTGAEGAAGAEPLALHYRPGFAAAPAALRQAALLGIAEPPAAYGDAGEAAAFGERILEALVARRAEDLARGVTQVGPHRDDLGFSLGAVDARTYGSRGQQRTIALALKMAEAQRMWSETGERPVLLLDDVLSELDAERRRFLLDRIDPAQQTLLTVTDRAGIPEGGLAGALVLRVEGARIAAASRDGQALTPPVQPVAR